MSATDDACGRRDSDHRQRFALSRAAGHLGRSTQILFPKVTGFGATEFYRNVQEPELRNLCATLYNDALAELQAEGRGRLFPMAIVPFWDLDAAVAEVLRVKELGLHGLAMSDSPEMADAPALHDPHWDPLWSAIAEVELPVNFHVQAGLAAAGTLALKPSHYFRRQIHTSFWFETKSLPEASQRGLLYQNAMELYRLPRSALGADGVTPL